MWLYTSYAVQPHRSVASKNGDFRYHGPKYNVLDVACGIALASLFIAHLPSSGVLASARSARTPAANSSDLVTGLNSCSIRPIAQVGNSHARVPVARLALDRIRRTPCQRSRLALD